MPVTAMPNLSIKNVPESVLTKLRQRAKRNQRSLQGELLVIVNEAAKGRGGPPPNLIVEHPPGVKSVEQIAAEIRARRKNRPEAADRGPLGVDIIRAARDAR